METINVYNELFYFAQLIIAKKLNLLSHTRVSITKITSVKDRIGRRLTDYRLHYDYMITDYTDY